MIIEKIFGKGMNSIEKSDLNKVIGVAESRSVEFKTIPDNDPTLKKWQLKRIETNNKENILKSVIGFLNAKDNGLLVVGVSTKKEVADKVSGVDKNVIKQLKNEISLEDFLKEKINTIPSYLDEFKLETKIVENDGGRIVIFIEVINKNWDRIYYSAITQYAYIREGKSTRKMSLQDTLKFIAERSYPQIYISFEELSEPNRNAGKIYPNYRINLMNRGVKPAERVHCFVLIGSNDKLDANQYGGYSASIENLDVTNYGLNNFVKNHEYIKIFQFIFPEPTMRLDRIYPFNKYSSGYVSIFEKDIEKIKKIIVLTIEDNGFVKQEFKVSKIDAISLEETKREFSPYLTI